MAIKRALLGLALLITAACGGGVILISFNAGVIASAPFCDNGTGRFDLQTQGGLLLLIVIHSDTLILNAGGHAAACTDLSAGTHVEVRGSQNGSQVTAQSVRIAGS